MSPLLQTKPRFRFSPQGEEKEFRLALASDEDRQQIYRLRHEVYARELAQHPCNDTGLLTDRLDAYNLYLVAWHHDAMVGFISITPPSHGSYSLEKYFSREQLPFVFDDRLYEIRLLTVVRERRRRELAPLLMYAAVRWVESRGGTRIVAIGRQEVVSLYRSGGMISTGSWVQSGAVNFELLHAPTETIRRTIDRFGALLDKLEAKTDWQLDLPFRKPAACFHGGTFFKAVGERFDSLERAQTIINADVLDAWFPPSPQVIAALQEHLPWLLRTSPPTDARGLVETIAEARGVSAACVLPGAGSSDLIFLALRHWLRPDSRVLILDPMYGEYAHLLERVIRCRVDRLPLRREEDYDLNLSRLVSALEEDYDLVVLVNPNSPTGRHVPRAVLEECLRRAPATTRVWLDETYVDYAGAHESLEQFAARSSNVTVCKSMSKVYALSGVRVAYLVSASQNLEELRAFTPPWAVSLPAQVAAVNALRDEAYYAARWAETHHLRAALLHALRSLKMNVVPGQANFLLAHLPANGPDAKTFTARCRERDLFLRDAAGMGTGLGDRAVRIAVKDAATQCRMLEMMRAALIPE